MLNIQLKGGLYTIIDDEDFDKISEKSIGVALNRTRPHLTYAKVKINGKEVLLHRLITGAKNGEVVDHVNGNGLDNRKSNLRICTHSQNSMNQRKQSRRTSSKYKGVRLHSYGNKWEVRIKKEGKRIHIGRFSDEIEAAKAYNEAAKKYHGEFASLNKI